MKQIHIRDSNFFSEKYPDRPNPYFKWIWDRKPVDSEITVFSDCFIKEAETSKSKKKIGWLIEPPIINEFIYQYVKIKESLFDLIFTFSKDLINRGPKYKLYPYGTTWIKEEERYIYKKEKICSTIVSSKRYTPGQQLRHVAVKMYGSKMDAMGGGYKKIGEKIVGLKDYMFSLTIENSSIENYFTEKIMDCFMTGTIPIYWGCKNISQFFNPTGILIFNSIKELEDIFFSLSEAEYKKRLPAVKENFNRAHEYLSLEKWLWNKGLKDV